MNISDFQSYALDKLELRDPLIREILSQNIKKNMRVDVVFLFEEYKQVDFEEIEGPDPDLLSCIFDGEYMGVFFTPNSIKGDPNFVASVDWDTIYGRIFLNIMLLKGLSVPQDKLEQYKAVYKKDLRKAKLASFINEPLNQIPHP